MNLPDDMCSLTREGAICIDFRPVSEIMLSIKSWEKGMGVKVWKNKEWRKLNVDPALALIRITDDLDGMHLVSRYINTIPREVRQAVEGIRYQQFLVLQYSSKFPAFRELLVSTPLLAWLLVSKSVEECWAGSFLNNLLEQKQPDILHKVAGVSKWADIKLLRKVKLLNGTHQEQAVLRKALRDSGLKKSIRHLPIVPVEVLAILHKLPEIQGARIVPYIIKEGSFINVNDALNRIGIIESDWNDILQMAKELDVDNVELARCQSEDDLFGLHQRWVQRLNADRRSIRENIVFPEPPFPDSENIVAIKTSVELAAEGRVMSHCVGAFSADVIEGKCYIYRVLEPERATLELRLEDELWQIGQFKLKNNELPGRQSLDYVMEWLKQGQIAP